MGALEVWRLRLWLSSASS